MLDLFPRPAIVVTAQPVLRKEPTVVQVVPLTGTIRDFQSEVAVEPAAGNGLNQVSAAQCQHVRSVSAGRVTEVVGNVGGVVLAQIRDVLAALMDL